MKYFVCGNYLLLDHFISVKNRLRYSLGGAWVNILIAYNSTFRVDNYSFHIFIVYD